MQFREVVSAGLRLVFFIAVFVPVSAWAQADLNVTVLDGVTKQPVAGVTVTLENASTGYDAKSVTDERGNIHFGGLPTSGSYMVKTAETPELLVAESAAVQLRSDFNRTITLLVTRKAADAREQIVVTGRHSIASLNRVNAEVSSSLSETDLRTLPVEARDVTHALYRLPNVTQATGFYPEAPNVSINGANSLFTNYLIDGMDNNENFLGGEKFPIPVGFTQNVTVLANNFSAEFGRSANGIVNMTSKSGSNDVTGEVYFTARPGALAGSSNFPTRDLSGNVVQDNFTRYQGGFSTGGPIIEDKTFFYVNLEYTRDIKENLLSSPELGVSQPIGGTNEFWLGSLRLDQVWSDNWRSNIRFNYGAVSIGNQAGGIGGGVTFPSAADSQDRTSTLLAFSTTYSNGNFVYEGNFQYSRFRWNYGAAPPGPQVVVDDPSGQTIAVLGNPGFIFDSYENTYQTQQKFTLTTNRQTFKAGADVIVSRHSLFGGGNVNGNYEVQLTPGQLTALAASGVGANLKPENLPANVQVLNYGVEVQPNAFGKTQSLFGVYFEDQIAATSRLNLTGGLRWDYDSLTKMGTHGSGELGNIAPRFSANYSLNERMVLRGGVGLFYDKIPYTVISDALQGNSTSPAFKAQLQQLIALGRLPANTDLNQITFNGNLTVNPTCTTYLNCPTPAQAANLRDTSTSNFLRILDPNGYKDARALHATVGYQWQINDTLLFYTDAIYSRTNNLVRLVDLNAPAPFAFNFAAFKSLTPAQIAAMTPAQREALGLVRSVASANLTRPVAPVAGGATGIIVSDTGGTSEYKGLNLTFVKDKGEDKYAYRLSYTLSRLMTNTEDINSSAANENNFAAEWGPSQNDRTHVISGILYLYLVDRWSFSVAALLQSGQPINYEPDASVFGTTDINGDGPSYGDTYDGTRNRYPGASRNSGRLPWSKTFDLGAEYDLPLTRGTFAIRMDIFNIFNANNLSGYSVNYTVSNQVQLGGGAPFVQKSAAPPRAFQFSGRYVF